VTRRRARVEQAAPEPPSLFRDDDPGVRSQPPERSESAALLADPGATPASAITVATLAAATRDIVEGALPALWVRGEVVGFKSHRRGHWYFTLKDDTAQVRCVVWASDQRRFMTSPDEGMAVVARGRLTVYPAKSDLQFRVFALEAVGDGMWRKGFDLARARLEADGLLAPERKRPLPRFPRRVAVITSTDGAALHDVIAVVRRRCPVAEIVAVPAVVQGDGSAASLCTALARVARWGKADVVIIGRGGGGREDLWAFNDERVARALAACPVPTIAAIGHEVDVTLCDLVADWRAATPSAAGEAAVPVLADLRAQLRSLGNVLCDVGDAIAQEARTRLSGAARALTREGERFVERRQLRLERTTSALNALSPLGTLERGFAVLHDEAGRVVASVAAVSQGDALRVRLRDGNIFAHAERIEAAKS
jgi:exodeoxyribonuclease VII large subunit